MKWKKLQLESLVFCARIVQLDTQAIESYDDFMNLLKTSLANARSGYL